VSNTAAANIQEPIFTFDSSFNLGPNTQVSAPINATDFDFCKVYVSRFENVGATDTSPRIRINGDTSTYYNVFVSGNDNTDDAAQISQGVARVGSVYSFEFTVTPGLENRPVITYDTMFGSDAAQFRDASEVSLNNTSGEFPIDSIQFLLDGTEDVEVEGEIYVK
jgi:hypothetical protein